MTLVSMRVVEMSLKNRGSFLSMQGTGYRVKEPKDSKALTHCCGGPIESIFPKTANQIGEKRVEQLKDTKAQSAALMCPICLATL